MVDLIEELREVRAEAPEAHLLFALQYPAGRSMVVDATDPGKVVAYADQIRDGVARLLTIYAITPGESAPVVRSYAEIEEEREGLQMLAKRLLEAVREDDDQ